MKSLCCASKISRLYSHIYQYPQLGPQSFQLPPYFPLGGIRRASAVGLTTGQKNDLKKKFKKKKKKKTVAWKTPNVGRAEQFSLLDAIRYLRAFEVGRPPKSVKYELAVRMRSIRNGPMIRNRLQLPHPIKTDLRIAFICPSDHPAASAAREAGASHVGEDDLIARIKGGEIFFDRLLCHSDSSQKLNKAAVGRILGPKGLMPSAKLGTIVRDVKKAIGGMVGANEYREKQGVIRMAIGQLGFTPEEVQANIQRFMATIKSDMALLAEKVSKEIHEVVLSSTNGPGFSLNGDFKSPSSPPTRDLTIL